MQYAIEYNFAREYPAMYSPPMDSISSRLDWAMQEARFESQSALARASGVPQPTINRILKGGGRRGPESDTIKKLAAACNVSFDWLNEGIGEPSRLMPTDEHGHPSARRIVVTHPDMDQYPGAVYIRKVKLQLSAGILGFSVEEDVEDDEPIMLPQAFLDRKGLQADKLIVLSIKGESMLPKMPPGTVVIINTADTLPKHDEVYAVNYNGEAVIKRLKREMGFWWLFSDNPDQQRFPQQRCAGDECIIIGIVVRSISDAN